MKTLLIFILGCVFTKLVDNNLPNMSFQNLRKIYKEKVIPALPILYLAVLLIYMKLTKNSEQQKQILLGLGAMLVVIITFQAYTREQEKQQLQYPDSVY